jgi:hypothetical protein
MRTVQIDVRWAVTVLVAGYGAVLSTYNTYISRKQSRHQIKVKISFGWLTYGPNLGDDMVMTESRSPGGNAHERRISFAGWPTIGSDFRSGISIVASPLI